MMRVIIEARVIAIADGTFRPDTTIIEERLNRREVRGCVIDETYPSYDLALQAAVEHGMDILHRDYEKGTEFLLNKQEE